MSYYDEVVETTQEIVDHTSDAAESLAEVYLWLWLGPSGLFSERSRSSQERAATVVRIRSLLREAMGGGVDREATAILERLSESRLELERAMVVWVELIEALVQHVEHCHGEKQGSQKASEVKVVVRHLLSAERIELPNIPEFFVPIVIDIVVEWTIETVVLMANDYGLWAAAPSSPRRRTRSIFRGWAASFYRLALRVFSWVNRHLGRGLRTEPLPTHLRDAVAAVEREGLIVSQKEMLRSALDILAWIGKHRRQVLAAARLVFESVQEAEQLRRMSGPEKKAYAYDLVLAVILDMGYEKSTGLVFGVIDSLINGGIEASVTVFNKRGWR